MNIITSDKGHTDFQEETDITVGLANAHGRALRKAGTTMHQHEDSLKRRIPLFKAHQITTRLL